MEYKIILGTNIWGSFLNEKEINHQQTVKIVNSFEDIVIPDFILFETLTILKIKSSLNLAFQFYKIILDNSKVKIENFNLNSETFYSEFLDIRNLKLSFVDSSLLSLHKTKKYKVITFDKNLGKLL